MKIDSLIKISSIWKMSTLASETLYVILEQLHVQDTIKYWKLSA